MARTLNTTIVDIFEDNSRNGNGCPSSIITTGRKFMEIPVNDEVFEMPVFAFFAFRDMLKKGYSGTILVASLYASNYQSSYRTLGSILKEVLITKCSGHLQKFVVPNSDSFYYATHGAIFDKDFKPLMMMSWLLGHSTDSLGHRKIKYIRPIIRLDTLSFVAKEDALQRFLSGRFLTTSLGMSIQTPYFGDCNNYFEQVYNWWERPSLPARVEIDMCPFCIRETDVPSISTTNESLLALADAHIDEVII